ncbi:cytochrome C biogenesis protein transmembrane region [mine drainage metagenome]|uniref:Cytochrome C biogenesis protein transmembrane region n=1 Tax=mine drainage metagenome TaxID=410659 RepID=A0A1J5QG01_9ZZZZ
MSVDVGFLAAFLGGALALLSPCGALLLPSFFASTVGTGGRLLLHGAVFYLGLTLTLVPVGLGASLVGAVFVGQRGLLITVAGWLIIAFGLMQILGLGFDMQRLVPGARRVAADASRRRGFPRSLLLGAVSGFAGFCAGPILGAVLSLAATRGSVLAAGVMLAVYGAGMVAPLILLAGTWSRLGAAGRSRLRGRGFTVGRFHLHTTSMATGAMLVTVGIVFLTTNGLVALPELVPSRVLFDLQVRVETLGAAVPDAVFVGAAALVALAAWFTVTRRPRPTPPSADPAANQVRTPVRRLP